MGCKNAFIQTPLGWDAMKPKLEDIYVEGLEFEPEVIAWMKAHSVREIKSLAEEVEEHGEDAKSLKEFYKELRAIEKDWAKHAAGGHYHVEEKQPPVKEWTNSPPEIRLPSNERVSA
jgi:hypothetical protein